MAKRSKAETAQSLEGSAQFEPRSRPIQERSKETVNRILETTAELIDEVGIVGFNTNLLAERADIRVRTIYRYFPNKLGILCALMEHLNEESAERLKQLSELGDPESDWRELVGRWFDDVLKWTSERPGARLLMGWSHNIPELIVLEDRIDEQWAHSFMDAMSRRGVDLTPARLYAVCRTFNESFDAMTSLASWDDQECAEEIVEEARRMLILYLEQYLD